MPSTVTQSRPTRVLALDLGRREIGYAILEETRLVYFGVHTVKGRRTLRQTLRETQRFVDHLITILEPELLVLERSRYKNSRRSTVLPAIIADLKRLARQRHLIVRSFTPKQVKLALCENERATKRKVSETIVTLWYPFLAKYLETDRRTKEKYWENVFDAIALGLAGLKALDSKRFP